MLSIDTNIIGTKQSIDLTGQLMGIDALEFRQKLSSLIDSNADCIHLSLIHIESIDLTGFNAIVMLKKEANNQKKNFSILVNDNNIQFFEYLHLSKLNLNVVKSTQQ